MVGLVHASPPARDESGARGAGPSGRSPEASETGRPGVPARDGIDDTGSDEAVQHRAPGDDARSYQVSFTSDSKVDPAFTYR